MRVRTEEKKGEIVAVAAQLFLEQGFERTSMSQISQRLGGSKATLYGYFKSKEELFLATINYEVTANAEVLTRALLSPPTVREGLVALGKGYLELRLGPRPISNFRIVSTQPAETGIGRTFYDNLIRPAWQRLANRFELMMDEGKLRRADPWIAAMHWKGLIEGDIVERRLLSVVDKPDPREIQRLAVAAADAFMQVYGADRAAPPQPRPRTAARTKRKPARPAKAVAPQPARRGSRAAKAKKPSRRPRKTR